MTPNPVHFTDAYDAALRRYWRQGSVTLPMAAARLGRRALKSGMKHVELVLLHGDVLNRLLSSPGALGRLEEKVRRAGLFLAGVLTPWEDFRCQQQVRNVQLQLVKCRQLQKELQDLSRGLLTAQEAERKRISRELHDVIGQSLTGIALQLAALKSQTASQSKALSKRLCHTQELVEKSAELVHRLASSLRPAALDDLGLIPGLQSYVINYMERTGVRVDLRASADVELMDAALRTVLYRIVEAALTNVTLHSKAVSATVSMGVTGGRLLMEITDHGAGFPVDQVMDASSSSSSTRLGRLGLLGMRERVAMAGGTFGVSSTPGLGTAIRVEFPCRRSKGRRIPLSETGKPGQ